MDDEMELQDSTSEEGAEPGAPEEEPTEADDQVVDGDETEGDEPGAPATRTGRVYTEDEWRKLQSAKDREVQAERERTRQMEQELAQFRQQLRELQLAQIPEDKRDAVLAQWDLEDKQKKYSQYETALGIQAKEIKIKEILLDYRKYGVIREDLEDCETPEQMEVRAERKAREWFERELKNVKKEPRKTPAIAKSKVDSGGAGATGLPDPKNFKGKPADYLRAKRQAGLL